MNKIIIKLSSLQAPERDLIARLYPEYATPEAILQVGDSHKRLGIMTLSFILNQIIYYLSEYECSSSTNPPPSTAFTPTANPTKPIGMFLLYN
jgi:hypothetical protein